jgi:hypothetical protein
MFFLFISILFFIRSLFQLNLYIRMIHESNICTLKATRPTKITPLQHNATTIILLRFYFTRPTYAYKHNKITLQYLGNEKKSAKIEGNT